MNFSKEEYAFNLIKRCKGVTPPRTKVRGFALKAKKLNIGVFLTRLSNCA